ncbi:hypothetical protein Scep_000563 [Stephania cephalantha]|uniref:Uncharacterized protein n=1 Tax=Stephania cephalantha TaxID=152367 RepID=A0AAP0L6B0_9MAGN
MEMKERFVIVVVAIVLGSSITRGVKLRNETVAAVAEDDRLNDNDNANAADKKQAALQQLQEVVVVVDGGGGRKLGCTL